MAAQHDANPRGRQRGDQCSMGKGGWTWSWTAIWTVLAFLLLLFHGDSILAFAAEQLRARRLDLQREKTRQAMLAQQRDPLV